MTLEKAKKLINDPKLSDQEIEQLIHCSSVLAEILFEKWLRDNQPTHEQYKT